MAGFKKCAGCGLANMPVEAKGRFCSKACYRAWWGRDSWAEKMGPAPVEQACAQCGGSFVPRTRHNAKYCSKMCRDRVAYANQKVKTAPSARPCAGCGAAFVSGRSFQKFCSKSCYMAAWTEDRKGKEVNPSFGEATCEGCGGVYSPRRRDQQYCSRACRPKLALSGRTGSGYRRCPVCATSHVRRGGDEHCGEECRGIAAAEASMLRAEEEAKGKRLWRAASLAEAGEAPARGREALDVDGMFMAVRARRPARI